MGTHGGAIEEVHGPVQGPDRITLGLHGGQESVPDPGPLPAAEARVHRLPGTVPLRQIAPWHTGGQSPEDGIDDQAMVVGRSTGGRALGRQERRQPLPLRVAEFMSASHRPRVLSLCKHALVNPTIAGAQKPPGTERRPKAASHWSVLGDGTDRAQGETRSVFTEMRPTASLRLPSLRPHHRLQSARPRNLPGPSTGMRRMMHR
jgi:hypothetical protein